MFYFKTGLIRRIRLHPRYIGDKNGSLNIVRKLAVQSFKEAPFNTEYGYITSLIRISGIGDGFCLPVVGQVEFTVTFDAIVLYPIVGETIYAEVVMVTETCVIFRHACVYGVVREYALSDRDHFKYEERPIISQGKTAYGAKEAEGLYRSEINPSKTIEKDTVIRVRIMQRTLGGNGFFLIGSMFGDFLGPMENPPPPASLLPSLSPAADEDVLKNLKVESDVLPLEELQKIWKQFPYNPSKSTDDDDDTVSVIIKTEAEPDAESDFEIRF